MGPIYIIGLGGTQTGQKICKIDKIMMWKNSYTNSDISKYWEVNMKNSKVEAFNIKSGPTESGIEDGAGGLDGFGGEVGGEVFSIDKLSVFLSQYWLLLLLILIPFSYVIYKKRKSIPIVFFKLQNMLIRLKTHL